MKTYVLGGGCFWCIDAVYRRIHGVTDITSGYAGGASTAPTYADVSRGDTGHAEVVKVTFDESIIPAQTILAIFFTIHNPTTLNQQGADIGTQYRSILLYENNEQFTEFQTAIDIAQSLWSAPIVTELKKLETFYPAEDEHQNYFDKHPTAGYCSIVIAPKLIKARNAYQQWFKEDA